MLKLKLKLQYFGQELCEELTHLKRPWCWERLKAEGKGDDRGWDGWMASPAQWTWVWASSGSWWCTGKPFHVAIHGVVESQTWLSNWTELIRWVSITISSISSFYHKCFSQSSLVNILNIWTYILHATLVICLSHYRNDVYVLSYS